MELCKCGCGKEVTKEGNRYLQGHYWRGKTFSEETKLKMRGRESWNKGKIGVYSKETYAKMRVSSTYNLKDWEEKCPLLSKMEEMKEKDGKILTHCTNHNCPNSKEKGGWFILKREQISNRMFELNNGKDNGCFYCSENCKKTCIKFHKSAVQLQNEIEIASGIREESLYTSEEYNTWKKEVFRRYKEEFGCIECEYCGNRNIKELSVHHEKPQKTHPHLALDPDNGIIACNQFSEKKCHYKYGHPTGTECSTGNLANKIC